MNIKKEHKTTIELNEEEAKILRSISLLDMTIPKALRAAEFGHDNESVTNLLNELSDKL